MKGPQNLKQCYLYAIIDTAYLQDRDPIQVTAQMIKGGVDIIQLRAKDMSRGDISSLAKDILKTTKPAAIPFIINDDPEIAKEVQADGVHVGQDDISINEARRIMGIRKWVGKSTHSLGQALTAQEEGADYIGVGPIFATPTKPNYLPVGLELIGQVKSKIKVPFFCIGGIKLENITQVLKAGAQWMAVVSGILKASDITDYCHSLKEKILKSG